MNSVEAASTHNRQRRRWKLRLAALALALSPLLIGELVCRAFGLGQEVDALDPYVDFVDVRPLFERNESGEIYEIPISRQLYFAPQQFSAVKQSNEFRIFCLGGSTVRGRPYSTQTSFTSWLQIALREADSSRDWRVINCGGVSYASYRLVPILEEALRHEADLIIVYTGHNEFLEDRTYQNIKSAPHWLKRAHRFASCFHSYVAFRNSWLAAQKERLKKQTLPTEVAARLDDGRLEDYRRDPQWRHDVIAHYASNLERMCQFSRQSGVPLYFVEPVCNRRDCPPFKSEAKAGLSEKQLATVEQLWEQANHPSTEIAARIELLEQALEIDTVNAQMMYHLAKCYEAEESFDQARSWFDRALKEDTCPLRILDSMIETLNSVTRSNSTPIVSTKDLFTARSPGGIPGNETFVDHVHPTIEMHQLIGTRIARRLSDDGYLTIPEHWESARKLAFAKQMASLGDQYYELAEERLEGLKNWAAGRAGQLPVVQEKTGAQ